MTLRQALDLLERERLITQRHGLGTFVASPDLTLHSLRHILRYKLGLEIVRARETVSAARLTGREAGELDCRPGSPAFCSERVSFSADGRPVVFDRVDIPGDRFRITRELRDESSRP
jgi:DNA-binding GntR family transcriptional regulator